MLVTDSSRRPALLYRLSEIPLTGTFKLELAVHPLMHFLAKDMDWARMLAEDKNIDVVVEDSTAAPSSSDTAVESSKREF